MNSIAILAAAASVLCISAAAADAKDIKKKQQFMDAVIGKKLVRFDLDEVNEALRRFTVAPEN